MGVKDLPDWYGVTLTEQITQYGDPIKAMYILGLNPAVTYPDSNHIKSSLEKLDFLVLQDIFLTETSQYADVILPGACFAEKDGTFTRGGTENQPCQKGGEPTWRCKGRLGDICRTCKEDGVKRI
jgi:formate dehydrogenase major subunit